MTTFQSQAYYVLDPNVETYDEARKLIPIESLVEETYGKPFSSLRACQLDHENLSNDSTVEYRMANPLTMDGYLGSFDSTSIYLGLDSTMNAVVIEGKTQVEYWKTITWLDDTSDQAVSPEDVAHWEHMVAHEPGLLESIPYQMDRKERYERGELSLVEVNPPKTKDLTGAVFQDEHFAQRAFSPSLGAIIADLIRRGILPQGNYLFNHSW